jgi:S-DNA-T family DNA segregation ATPase FtsK/SpoIIIE
MSHKTIKISLLILLLLVGLNTISFIFGETVPDNIYLITDSTNTVNSFTYYLFSFLSFIAYYTGVWLVLPLLLLSMSYILVINKRDKSIDSIIPLILLTFSFCFSIILLPEFVGVGLLKLTKEVTTFSELTLYTVLFAFISFFIILRGSVKYVTSMLHDFGLGMIRMIAKQTKRFVAYLKSLKEGEKPLVDFSKITGKLTFALRKSGASNNIPIQNNPHEDSYRQYSEVQKMQPEVSVEKDRIQNLETKEIKEEERNSILPKLEIKKPKVRKVSVQDQPSFESKSLIECISSEDQKIKIDSPDEEYFKGIIQAIESKLAEFNIDSTVVNILKGPVVDTFELELGAGIKVSKVKNLSDDLGLALGSYIRIVVQMKGKSTIGVEVPRNPREIIYLDDVLKTDSYINTKHRLPIAMGKNAFGETHVVDLAGMPHMLVAGATGAGKSVFINTLLVSLIVKKSPKDLKLILIDPKQLELALYQRLPHLLMPVITEPKMAAVSLLWAVQEMERRYSILKEMGMRDIEGFNRKVKNAGPETLGRISGFYEDSTEEGYELPYLVCIVDEFADLNSYKGW